MEDIQQTQEYGQIDTKEVEGTYPRPLRKFVPMDMPDDMTSEEMDRI